MKQKKAGKMAQSRLLENLGLGETFLLDVVIQGASQCAAETRQMCAAVLLGDIVRIAEHILLVGVVPLHGNFYADLVANCREIEDIFVDRVLSSIRTPEFRKDNSRRRFARMS